MEKSRRPQIQPTSDRLRTQNTETWYSGLGHKYQNRPFHTLYYQRPGTVREGPDYRPVYGSSDSPRRPWYSLGHHKIELTLAVAAAILWGLVVATYLHPETPAVAPAKAEDLYHAPSFPAIAYHPQLLAIMPPPDWKPLGPIPPIKVQYLPRAMLPEACNLTPERLVGCSLLYRGEKCVIIIGIEESPELQQEVLKHETAHCQGWHHED